MKPLKVNNGQQEKQKTKVEEDKDGVTGVKEKNDVEEQEGNGVKVCQFFSVLKLIQQKFLGRFGIFMELYHLFSDYGNVVTSKLQF